MSNYWLAYRFDIFSTTTNQPGCFKWSKGTSCHPLGLKGSCITICSHIILISLSYLFKPYYRHIMIILYHIIIISLSYYYRTIIKLLSYYHIITYHYHIIDRFSSHYYQIIIILLSYVLISSPYHYHIMIKLLSNYYQIIIELLL